MAKKTYQDKLMQQAKNNISLGILSVPTAYAFGRVGSNHPATAPTANAVVGGMNLLNVGNVAKSGLLLTEAFGGTTKKKTIKDKRINKMI